MPLDRITDARSPAITPGVSRLPNLKALTSIRFFAALHVAFYHLLDPASLPGVLRPIVGVGYVGVSFFFLLSGYILTYSHALEYERGKGVPTKFWLARFARIYPLYLVSMILAAYVNSGQFHQKIHILAFIADLFVVQSWSIRMVNFFNVPAWSVANEAFFYFVFPFVLMRLRPSSARRALLAVAFFWVAAIAAPLLCVWLRPQVSWHEDAAAALHSSSLVFRVRRLPIFALPQFLAGISLGWFFLRYRPSKRAASWLAFAGVVLSIAMFMLSHSFPMIVLHNGLLIPVFAMLILGLSADNWISRLFSIPPLVLLGESSFALYLLHFLFNDWVKNTFGVGSSIHAALGKLAIVIPISILLHLGIERPCRRWILQWWSRRHPAQLTVA